MKAAAFREWLIQQPLDANDASEREFDGMLKSGAFRGQHFPTLYSTVVDAAMFAPYVNRVKVRLGLHTRVTLRRIVVRTLDTKKLVEPMMAMGLWNKTLQDNLRDNIIKAKADADEGEMLERGMDDFHVVPMESLPSYSPWMMCYEAKPGQLVPDSPGVCTIGAWAVGDFGLFNEFAHPGRLVRRASEARVFDGIHAWLSGRRPHLLPLATS